MTSEKDGVGRKLSTRFTRRTTSPGHEIRNTATLDEIDERTTLTTHLLYKSKADRDGHIQSGMEAGASQSHDRLATLLASMR